jgi:hypothetical protein
MSAGSAVLVCLPLVINVTIYVRLIDMEHASKRELLVIVNKQKDQLSRYESRLRGKLTSQIHLSLVFSVFMM